MRLKTYYLKDEKRNIELIKSVSEIRYLVFGEIVGYFS